MKNYKAWIISRKNLKVIFNMEENIQEVKKAKLYGNASWRRPRDQRKEMNRKEGKKQGKANFFEKECLHWRKWEEDDKVIHGKLWRTRTMTRTREKMKRKIKDREESEGKEEKNTMQ